MRRLGIDSISTKAGHYSQKSQRTVLVLRGALKLKSSQSVLACCQCSRRLVHM